MNPEERHEAIWARWEKAAAEGKDERVTRALTRLICGSDLYRDDAAYTLAALLEQRAIRDEDVIADIDAMGVSSAWWRSHAGKELAIALDNAHAANIRARDEQAEQDHIDGTDKLVAYDMFED